MPDCVGKKSSFGAGASFALTPSSFFVAIAAFLFMSCSASGAPLPPSTFHGHAVHLDLRRLGIVVRATSTSLPTVRAVGAFPDPSGDGRFVSRPRKHPPKRWVRSPRGGRTAFGRRLVEWTVVATPVFALTASSVLDHRLAYDDHGIFYRPYQLDFEHGVMALEGVGALWFGARTRLGRTFWQAIDSSLFTAATTTVMKYAFSRARPYQSSDPHDFFQGNCCQSFPSGEVAYQASVVTPFIAEYRRSDPWIWALEIFPLYDAVARMKTRGHWQTDVISGFAIGTAWGIFAHEERVPFTVSLLPGGVTVGLERRF
jgi:undecaprenyl-diphosphatase